MLASSSSSRSFSPRFLPRRVSRGTGSIRAQSGYGGSFAVLGGTEVTVPTALSMETWALTSARSPIARSRDDPYGRPDRPAGLHGLLTAYTALAAEPCDVVLTGTLAGVALPPGVYCFDSAATLTGVLTLDGPSDGTWIFKVGPAAPAPSRPPISRWSWLRRVACNNNVFWWTADGTT